MLYLPSYSPDFNPFEQAFSKFKALLQESGERTRVGLWSAIAHILELYRRAECRNLFRHSGYLSYLIGNSYSDNYYLFWIF